MEEQKCFRQGELIFIPIKVSKGIRTAILAAGLDKGRNIREGEVSGHIHAASSGTLVEMKGRTYYEQDKEGRADYQTRFEMPAGEMFLTSENTIKITHPEHATLPLAAGDYVIRVQREYDEERDRQVAD